MNSSNVNILAAQSRQFAVRFTTEYSSTCDERTPKVWSKSVLTLQVFYVQREFSMLNGKLDMMSCPVIAGSLLVTGLLVPGATVLDLLWTGRSRVQVSLVPN